MKKSELESEIAHLKSDYIRIQSDLDKMESVGGSITPIEKVLEKIEIELAEKKKQLNELEK
uniref:SE1832 family protein n=1 Tax=uncultured Allobacillus sp. TaxID=1638025 RepID=UPI002596FFAA|nr:SE1832 family protein [uncultured Allobacillus sp.]